MGKHQGGSFHRRASVRNLIATACVCAAVAPAALAVNVSPQGLGQVLLFPYYTVRAPSVGGAYSTLFTITNTTADTKVIRLRFRESRNGREVASLNVYLSSYDSWTGAVVAGASGPMMITSDKSCTDPRPTLGTPDPITVTFSNAQYSGANADGEDTSLDRASEGYFEVFEMGVVKDAAVVAAVNLNRNCFHPVLTAPLDNVTKVGAPTGGLSGNANIISVGDGTLYSYDATALGNFSLVPLWAPPTAPTPTLSDVNPKVSRVFDNSGYRESTWDVAKGASAVDPVSAVLMVNQLTNWFILDAATTSGTDWVVTMPTKPSYVGAVFGRAGVALPPFQSNFWTGGAPDVFATTNDCAIPISNRTLVFSREGDAQTGCAFDLPSQETILSWTANVVTFKSGNSSIIFGSGAATTFGTIFANGWGKLLPLQYATGQVHRLVSTDTPPVTYYGLPMIGFMANDYVNKTLTVAGQKVLSNYSATSPHKGIARIQ